LSVLSGRDVRNCSLWNFYLVFRFTPSDFPPPVNVFGSYLGCGRFESRLDHLNVVRMIEMLNCLCSHSRQVPVRLMLCIRCPPYETFQIYFFTVRHSYDALIQGCINTGLRVVLGPQFCTVAPPNILGPPAWNLLHVTFPAPRILRWLLDFWKILYTSGIRF